MPNPDGPNLKGFLREIHRLDTEGRLRKTEARVAELERRLSEMSQLDPLTGLPNHRRFSDRLSQALLQAQRHRGAVGVLYLDLDRFKRINELLGHDGGDEVLRQMAVRLAGALRQGDTLACMGGGRFMVLLPELKDALGAIRAAQKLLETLQPPFPEGSRELNLGASIGACTFPQDGLDAVALQSHAEAAMYRAKERGGGRIECFTATLNQDSLERQELEQCLREALRNGELQMYYQPQFFMDGRLAGAEALLRWNHPGHGQVPPAEFVPLAEETGLILDIGDWVFKEAARYAKLWQGASPDLQISVNMSPLQFHNEAHVVQDWLAHLLALGLSGRSVAIEITESLLLEADSGVTDKLLAFRDAEIQVAIDDFGTGYSSLSYLNKYHIDYLKIDQFFVRNLVQDANSRTLSEAIIAMAHKLGLKVIAEGIETAEQRSLLKAAGCDFGQGYLYSRPVPAIEFEALLLRPVSW